MYILILENKAYNDVIGSPAAPYLNSLADQSAVAANYYAVGHPSQPNYLALFAGSTFGVADNYVHQISAPNLADQLEEAGLTWSVYAENVPTDCFAGEQAADGEDGAGTYARKHNPAISFTSVATNAERCDRIRDFSHFAPLQANVSFIIPNLCHDMHDCAVSVADAWLREFVPRIIDSDDFHRDGVLFITFDEGDGDNNHVATIAVSPFAERGARSTTRFDHYSLLRTVEQLVGVDCLAESCNATPMTELFQAR